MGPGQDSDADQRGELDASVMEVVIIFAKTRAFVLLYGLSFFCIMRTVLPWKGSPKVSSHKAGHSTRRARLRPRMEIGGQSEADGGLAADIKRNGSAKLSADVCATIGDTPTV